MLHCDWLFLTCNSFPDRPGTLLDFRSQDLAEQLTLMDSDLFCKIEVQICLSLPVTLPHLRYSLQRDDDIMSFFNDFSDHLAEEALWELSLRIRPRNASRTNQR
ncbi:hypothetical protein XENOCAPTIV_016830 [Xenoophorus captivus]|uniref:Ras-GEF domain-containing protein n=1 Tax=Xenoophorus captivus TaxID=1517983 RepID=A0ABV0R980_9TELE